MGRDAQGTRSKGRQVAMAGQREKELRAIVRAVLQGGAGDVWVKQVVESEIAQFVRDCAKHGGQLPDWAKPAGAGK